MWYLLRKIFWRQRFLGFIVFSAVAVSGAAFLAYEFGGRQPVTSALDVGFSVIRLIVPLFIVVWAQELFFREFDRRIYLSSMAYPVSRAYWFLARALVIIFAVLLVAAIDFFVLALTVDFFRSEVVGWEGALGGAYWVYFVFCFVDFIVLVSVALLLSVVSSGASFILIGTFGFMLFARSYASVIALLARDATLVGASGVYSGGISGLGYFVVDLAALDVRGISLYGDWRMLPDDWFFSILAALAYAASFLIFSVWFLNRKRLV